MPLYDVTVRELFWFNPGSPAQLGVVDPVPVTVEQVVFQHQDPAGRVVRTRKVFAEALPWVPSQNPDC